MADFKSPQLVRIDAPTLRKDLFSILDEDFNKFFDSFFRRELGDVKVNGTFPPSSVYERDGKFVIKLAVSGMTVDDIEIDDFANEGIVVISGRMSEDYRSDESVSKYYIREIKETKFKRSFRLPDDVAGDADGVLKDGILTLTWNLKPPPDKPKNSVKKINVRSE